MKINTINISSSISEKDVQAPGESSNPPKSSSKHEISSFF